MPDQGHRATTSQSSVQRIQMTIDIYRNQGLGESPKPSRSTGESYMDACGTPTQLKSPVILFVFFYEHRRFADEFGATYPIVADDGSVKPGYEEVVGMPTTLILKKNGEIEPDTLKEF